MKKILTLSFIAVCIFILSSFGSALNHLTADSMINERTDAPGNWFNLDLENDSFNGVSTDRAYKELLAGKESKKVVVAILDSGIDFLHEDLKDRIWTNVDEIPDNGTDDDNNGYVDDVRGWNFLGSKDGMPVTYDTYEVTRLYKIYKPLFGDIDTTTLSRETRKEYELYKTIKADYENLENKYIRMFNSLILIKKRYDKAEKIVLEYLGVDSVSLDQLQEINADSDSLDIAVELLTRLKKQDFDPGRILKGLEKVSNIFNYNLNMAFDPRHIVGDNYEDPGERFYGNPYVHGPEPSHGTHVCGIIAADRDNHTGIQGIAQNVEIMILRVVPDGDERDKDVANAVYYAVDNGARIINMSFGKGYSPYKEYVDNAFRYAAERDVLIVHASGNDSENNDRKSNYPSRFYCSGGECETWIEVGAINWKTGPDKISGFTNYGKKNIDLFAPGEDIYSTVPGDNYRHADGTSMAAPIVSGVAALVWSYYPDLSAKQLKKIILTSSVNYKKEKVLLPGSPEKTVKFSRLSRTGGVVNAYRALEMAGRIDHRP